MIYKKYLLEQDDFDWDVTTIDVDAYKNTVKAIVKKLIDDDVIQGDVDYDSSMRLTVYGDVRFFGGTNSKIYALPVHFNEVHGDFSVSGNALTSLEGCPIAVSGGFYCYGNNLKSLAGCPKEVGHDFDCSHNELTDLIGGPLEVGTTYNCSHNKLTSFAGIPLRLNGDLSAARNRLKTLEYGPEYVGYNYDVRWNKLVSLIGSPEEVRGTFMVNNNELKNFKNGPGHVGGYYHCSDQRGRITPIDPKEISKYTKVDVDIITTQYGA